MSQKKVVFDVTLAVNEGKLEAFQSIAEEMRAGTEKEAGAQAYEWYFSKDRTRCHLIEIYSDANAVSAHMNGPVVQDLVPKLLEVCSVAGFEVFGDPGAKAAEILTSLGAEIFQFWRGISR
jgi:quinol monooxygenase YgiN